MWWLAAIAAPLSGQKPRVDPGADLVRGEVGEALATYLARPGILAEDFCGVVFVAKGDEVLLQKGIGWADADQHTPMRCDTQWDWCSVTKQFTAAAVLRLVMQKKLDLDAPLAKVLPKTPPDKKKVTLRHLLNHTSGLAGGGDWSKVDPWDSESVVRHILQAKMAHEPGEHWEYSNAAYFLLGAIIEKVSGTTYERFLHKQLFEPAGMKDTGLIGEPVVDLARVPHQDHGRGSQFEYGTRMSWGYRGAGGVVATVQDMWRWDQALRGDKILDAARKADLYRPGLNHYALGWQVRIDKLQDGSTRTIYEHSGHTGKLVTYYLRQVDDAIVVAFTTAGEPKMPPMVLCSNLAVIARVGRAPPG